MIDIHSHVLFGLDDGAPTIEVSLAMARMAAEHGTTDLVATPHANLDYQFNPEQIAERLAQIEAHIAKRMADQPDAAPGPRLYTGCDFHLSYDNIQDALVNPLKYTINRKNYLLVEFSDLLIFQNTSEIFGRLGEAGMIPVITHPERNGLLRQRIEEIATWVHEGARVQVTAQSLSGGFGKRARDFARMLLDRGLVHVIASDAHDCEHRPPVLDQAHAWLMRHYGTELAQILCVGNPSAALTGDPMILPGDSGATRRKWYQVWR